MPAVSLLHCDEYDNRVLKDTIRHSLAHIGFNFKAFKKARVVVKPNIGWDRTPEQAANTHPLVVRTLVKMALEAGAAQVLVFDNPCNEERRCYVARRSAA